MDAIIEFFEGITDAITSVFDWFAGFLSDTVYFVELIGEVVASVPDYFSWLPEEALVALGVLLAVIVVCRILGREG